MKTTTVRIVDCGRGPQIERHRLTVMEIFFYLHRGYDFDFMHEVMPTLSVDEFHRKGDGGAAHPLRSICKKL